VVNLLTTPVALPHPTLLAAANDGADKLPPTTKAAAQMALVVIALVGALLIAMVLLGGHWVRRQGSPRRGPVVPPDRAPLTRSGRGVAVPPSADEESGQTPGRPESDRP
jgi:hypothetical protein